VQGWLEVVGGDWLANAGVLSLTVLAIAATVAGLEALMGGNLLRSTGFFDGAAVGGHVAVLAAWVLLGLGALFVAGLRGRRAATAAVPVPA